MKTILRPHLHLLLALSVLATLNGCATSDGGVGGTGIATVRGNVLDPEVTATALQPIGGNGASAAGITVSVRDTAVTDETDEFGFFELSGEIAGEITIDFARDNHPVAAAERVIVPVDAEITLRDVALLDSVAAPEAIEVDNVIATVVATPVCNEDATGSFLLRDEGGLAFAVNVDADTAISDIRGPLTCADVTEQSQIKFRGEQDGGSITATDIRVLKVGRPQALP